MVGDIIRDVTIRLTQEDAARLRAHAERIHIERPSTVALALLRAGLDVVERDMMAQEGGR